MRREQRVRQPVLAPPERVAALCITENRDLSTLHFRVVSLFQASRFRRSIYKMTTTKKKFPFIISSGSVNPRRRLH